MTPNDVKLKLVLKDKRLSASQRNDLEKWVDESLVRRIKDTTMVNRVYFMVRFLFTFSINRFLLSDLKFPL